VLTTGLGKTWLAAFNSRPLQPSAVHGASVVSKDVVENIIAFAV
jgi:hypothetical protein